MLVAVLQVLKAPFSDEKYAKLHTAFHVKTMAGGSGPGRDGTTSSMLRTTATAGPGAAARQALGERSESLWLRLPLARRHCGGQVAYDRF
jgi:hypothetical protein